MVNIPISNLVLRCYGNRIRPGSWYGVCLDLNIAVEAESPEQLKKKLYEQITSYVDSVLDTDDHSSIPDLFCRKAPLHDWLKYYCIKSLISIGELKNRLVFKEFIPVHLSHAC